MKCPNCGAELPGAASFCPQCGAHLQAPSAPATSRPYSSAASAPAQVTPPSVPGAVAGPTTTTAASGSADATRRMSADATRAYASPSAAPGQPVSGGYAAPDQTMRAAVPTGPVPAPESDPEEGYRRARETYKSARKAAGHSTAPKVVAVIVAALIIAGAGFTGANALLSNGGQAPAAAATEAATTEAPATTAAASTVAATTSHAAPTTSASVAGKAGATDYSAYDSYVGLWSGDFTATKSYVHGTPRCYGAKGNPLKIDIKSIDDTGQMTMSVTVLYHGHKMDDVESDVASMEGDAYLTFDDVTATFDEEKGFSFSIKPGGDKNYIDVTAVPSDDGTGKSFDVTVDSSYGETSFAKEVVVTDTYTITKS